MLQDLNELRGPSASDAATDHISLGNVAEPNNGKFDGKLAEIRERYQRWADRPAWVSLNEQAQFPKDVGILLAEVDRLRGASAGADAGLVAFLREQLDICEGRAAVERMPAWRVGWLRDAKYFRAALEKVEALDRMRAALREASRHLALHGMLTTGTRERYAALTTEEGGEG